LNLFFCVPHATENFPFLNGNIRHFHLNGYYFSETGTSFGLFWRTLPLFSFVYIKKLCKGWNYKKIIKYGLLVLIPGLFIPVFLAGLTWESGHAVRYYSDFASVMMFAAFAIIFKLHIKMKPSYKKTLVTKIFALCAILCVVTNLILVLQRIPSMTNTVYIHEEGTIFYYKLAKLFEFWR